MLMGTGNLTELTDADSDGVTAALPMRFSDVSGVTMRSVDVPMSTVVNRATPVPMMTIAVLTSRRGPTLGNIDWATAEPVMIAAIASDQPTAARDVDVPEPSPLFWDHLSARVTLGCSLLELGHAPHPLGIDPERGVLLPYREGAFSDKDQLARR